MTLCPDYSIIKYLNVQLSEWQWHSCQAASQGLQVWILLCPRSLSENGHSKAQIRQSRCANHLVYYFITEVSWRYMKCHSILKSTFLFIVVDCFPNAFLGQCAADLLQCFVAPLISADCICKYICSIFISLPMRLGEVSWTLGVPLQRDLCSFCSIRTQMYCGLTWAASQLILSG